MVHPYEYKVLVEYINPEKPGQIPHFTHEADQEGLTGMLEDVIAHLPASVPDGWEVLSHNLTSFRNTIIVSILLRRPVNTG